MFLKDKLYFLSMLAEYEKANLSCVCRFWKSRVQTTYLTAYTYFYPGFTESTQLHAVRQAIYAVDILNFIINWPLILLFMFYSH